MFPDSQIAKGFQCGRKKISYIISDGLGPYFKEKVVQELVQPEVFYSIMIDETPVPEAKVQQLDVLARYYSVNTHNVVVEHLQSFHLGHATADELFCCVEDALNELPKKNMSITAGPSPNQARQRGGPSPARARSQKPEPIPGLGFRAAARLWALATSSAIWTTRSLRSGSELSSADSHCSKVVMGRGDNGEREKRSSGESQGQAATHGDDQSSEGGPAATVGDAFYEQLQEEYETPASASSHQAATLRKAPRGKT
ncbi:hypothetical protein HPB47_010562 [Ixodes persulcatus]|uniref:Uncharacterized protein n=1 Tax=Ixodes persulcatus TaxID=34615 RepID=A0AC60NYZ8_IXOPE|nr:hypothetical protein HPB47_010562 [Ixodes persulcatus]